MPSRAWISGSERARMWMWRTAMTMPTDRAAKPTQVPRVAGRPATPTSETPPATSAAPARQAPAEQQRQRRAEADQLDQAGAPGHHVVHQRAHDRELDQAMQLAPARRPDPPSADPARRQRR